MLNPNTFLWLYYEINGNGITTFLKKIIYFLLYSCIFLIYSHSLGFLHGQLPSQDLCWSMFLLKIYETVLFPQHLCQNKCQFLYSWTSKSKHRSGPSDVKGNIQQNRSLNFPLLLSQRTSNSLQVQLSYFYYYLVFPKDLNKWPFLAI